MRGRVLHLPDHRHLLLEPGHDELVALAQNHIREGSRWQMQCAGQIDHEPPDSLLATQLRKQCLPHRQRLRRSGLVGSGSLQSEHGQIALHALGQQIHLLLLAMFQLLASEYAALREGVIRESPGPIEHREQRLAAPDGISAWEAHLAHESNALLRVPLGYLLDAQSVERLQLDVRVGIATQHCREIDRDQLRTARPAVGYRVARQLRRGAISLIGEPAAGAHQIGHGHLRLERILARDLDAAVDMDSLSGTAHAGLQFQLVHQRLDHNVTARGHIEHGNAIARQQNQVRR